MREIDILLSMLNQTPTFVRKHLPAMKMRFHDEAEVARDNPLYDWVCDNSAAAHLVKKLHEEIRKKRKQRFFIKDKLQQSIERRYAQANIDAVKKCIASVDVPFQNRVQGNPFRISIEVPGHEQPITKGRSHYGSSLKQWIVKLPMVYHQNVKQVTHARVHTVTDDGVKWLNFITKYNKITSDYSHSKVFSCEVSAFNPALGICKNTKGYYVEQNYDNDVLSAFAYSEKRALSLLNKRIKAAMLSKLGVA